MTNLMAVSSNGRESGTRRGPIWLASALEKYRTCGAKDPRDKVIALLGFLDESKTDYHNYIEASYK